MNDLEEFFLHGKHRLIHKWNHYFEIYNRHLQAFRGRNINILEIGISHGGSLEMWDHYFNGLATVYAVDINPECKKFESEKFKILIGSQEDENFLSSLKKTIPPIDILIDDGGHTMKQQIKTFEHLFSHVKEDGIYICEDLHTSYWKEYGGGYLKKSSFIEYSKKLIDLLNGWHSKKIKDSEFMHTAHSMHFYDSMLVVEKRKMSPPFDVKNGEPSIADQYTNQLVSKK